MKKIPYAEVVKTAREWIGTPYLHQGAKKHIGCDCLGLIRGVWQELGGSTPEVTIDYASAWSEVDKAETLLSTLRIHLDQVTETQCDTGQIVAFRMRPLSAAKHLAILTGEGTFIHAYDGNHVVENSMSSFWQSRIAGRFRFPVRQD